MTPGEIGTEAGRIFEYNLPPNWIFRSQEDQNDHGIDGEIEIKDINGVAKGSEHVFKVQIKGELTSSYIHNNKTLSFSLKTEKLRYYLSFNIPVILIVVEISSEKIYWASISDSQELFSKSSRADTDSIQIHLPVQNTIKRRNEASAQAILNAVLAAWDWLAIKGIKSSIRRFGELDSENLANKIFSMGDAFYKAHHQQLENFLRQRNFSKLYKVSSDLIQSPIVPAADRFVASLFYRTALRAAPRRQSMVDQIEDIMNISFMLIRLAREEKSPTLRCLAIGLARSAKFRYETNSLLANHNAAKAIGDGPEGYIFRLEIYKQYRSICLSIKKLIDLLGVAISKQQYHIFSDIYFESAASLSLFRVIQKERGNEEAISFFQNWIFVTFQFCIVYLAVVADTDRAKRLYSLALHAELFSENEKESLRARVLHINPDVLEVLKTVEIDHKPIDTGNFLEASTLEQIKYFKDTARNMGMDPDDSNNEMGQIVAMALKNYDPTEILSNCEHLFVHYRPAGIIAQTLQLHSAGGMHLLVCLRHQHVHGTGNLLTNLYSPPSNIPMPGFRKSHCDSCLDCSPRANDWKWTLAWQHEELPKHLDFLDKFNKW